MTSSAGGTGVGIVNAINDSRRALESELIDQSPVYAEFVKQMGRVYGERGRPDGLDQTQRVLMALAMAVHSGSQSAIEWTVTRAINHGASEAQIRDTMDVALLNGGTFTVSNFRFAHEALGVRMTDARRSELE
jgi:alkylhydroperoxidase/carboxymuconolactone decarboxylase family protein YurZ